MGILDRIISVQNNEKSLKSEGFTQKEIENLEFIFDRMTLGTNVGGLAAFSLSTYSFYNYLKIPERKRCFSTVPKTLIACLTLFYGSCYIFNSNRNRGDAYLSNFYSNNLLVSNRNELVREFSHFNRRFTNEEIQQFIFNEKLKTRGQKKYTFNPHVHGEEQEHKRRHETWNKGEWYFNEKTLKEIESQNQLKKDNGEKILLKPFKILDHLDYESIKKHKLKSFRFFEKNHVL